MSEVPHVLGALACALTMGACATVGPREQRLALPPLVTCTSSTATLINVLDPSAGDLQLDWREKGGATWSAGAPARRGDRGQVEWALAGLRPGARYEYRLGRGGRTLGAGSFVTARAPGEPFTFALISDPHVFVRDFSQEELAEIPLPAATIERYGSYARALWIRRMERAYARALLPRIARRILEDEPDFLINLGDILDLHGLGFNAPLPSSAWARKGYSTYRRLLGPLGSRTTHFQVLGNWDGEKGSFTPAERARARRERLACLPTPPGSPHRDYYALRWGDALFVVLNVVSYTRTEHALHRKNEAGTSDDYTLGAAQLAWLRDTLAASSAPWKFLCIHHAVGGRGGDEANSAYGRGGGRAARVGEQAQVHRLMREHGVQVLFYGHDHVFTDMVVDGIHYTLPGSCGAPWKFGAEKTGYERFWPQSGYARMRLEADVLEVSFISADGEVLHRFQVPRCDSCGAAFAQR